MSDLVEFLRARLDGEEQAARKVTAMTWSILRDSGGVRIEDENGAPIASDSYDAPFTADELEHIARHDPARVLREVEAKRRIIEEHEIRDDRCRVCTAHANGGWRRFRAPCPTLRFLVLPYADYPDYREEWRP